MTPAVIASAAQNASHTPVMPKSAAITSAQSTIAATPRRMDVIIAHFAAPTALRYRRLGYSDVSAFLIGKGYGVANEVNTVSGHDIFSFQIY